MKTLALALAVAGTALCGVGAADRAAEIKAEIEGIRAQCTKENRPLGEADEFGNYNLTDEGKRIAALEEELRKLKGETAEASEAALAQGWGTKPLGEPGTNTYGGGFKNKPEFRKAPVREPGLKLCGDGVKAAIFVDADDKAVAALAREFAWHLSEMTGEEFSLAKGRPTKGPAVIFRMEKGEEAHAVVKREGDFLIISGTGPGVGHATTYVLEALGIRYLWPGVTGKVIPKRKTVVLPELALDFRPKMKIRGIRVSTRRYKRGDRWDLSMRAAGLDPDEFIPRAMKAQTDHGGNRGFWAWHGINDSADSLGWDGADGAYRWGHAFEEFPAKYKESHPEFFALQPDGTRVREEMSRPCFCMSNPGFVAASVDYLLAGFAAHPRARAISACLPDGGQTSFCMCENCRRLDPVNAPALSLHFFCPSRTLPYVSRTDRVYSFFNALAEGVTARLPDRKLCVYAYSSYQLPPVKVRPHPALVILVVSGGYRTEESRRKGMERIAEWSSFGNELLWRPNALLDYTVQVPRNYARDVFEDIETLKVNNVVGTDISASDDSFATKGLIYYMTAKAHLNPDGLDYDTLYGDYLQAGFGPAADAMREWFDTLERDGRAVGRADIGKDDGSVQGQKALAAKRQALYVKSIDPERYAAILDRAETLAAGDAMILRRLGLFRTALQYARWQRRAAKDKKGFIEFIQRESRSDDSIIAVNPVRIGFFQHL